MCILLVAWGFLVAVAATASEVTATRLDGTAVVGSLQGWDQTTINIVTRDGTESLESSTLQSLQWTRILPPAATTASPQPLVELVDGTVLPVNDFQRSGNTATMSVRRTASVGDETITLPAKQVASVRLQLLRDDVAAQWDEIRSQQFSADVMVVLKRDGASLDYVEGVIGDISSDRVGFKQEDDVIEVDRGKVAGLIYHRGKQSVEPDPHCIVFGRGGLRASAAKAALEDGELQLTTVIGVELEWPIEDIHHADFSAGKVVFLSDLEPASAQWTPLIGLPDGTTLAGSYGRPRHDDSAFGGQLSLWLPSDNPSVATGQIKKFRKGLALRSRTELAYRLPRGYRKLLATAGIEPATRSSGTSRLIFHGDNRILYDAEVLGQAAPLPIELDIAGIKRLELIVDHGQNLDTGDWLNLCDIRIVK